MSEPTEVKALAPKLHAGRLKEGGFSWRTWHAEIAPETQKEAIVAPSFWTHHARQVQPRDEIVCLRDDMAWEATLRVICVNGPEVMVKVTRFVELEAEDDPQAASGEYFVKHRGRGKWAVMRKADNLVIKDEFGSKPDAVKFMGSLVRAAAA
jgi:hypothetical protein